MERLFDRILALTLLLALLSFSWMVLSWTLAGVEYWLVLRAFIPSGVPLWATFMLTMTLLGVAVPSSPGYIGVFEATGFLALSVFGVQSDTALTAKLSLHAMVFSIATALGAAALVAASETLEGVHRQTRDWLTV
jgi:uncharacterized membrane protein YbhN (UPF0104 family)